MFTYPSFEEVPCVVDSTDSTRPPTACTVRSQSHRFDSTGARTFKTSTFHHKQKTHTSRVTILERANIRSPPPDRMETVAAHTLRLCGITSDASNHKTLSHAVSEPLLL